MARGHVHHVLDAKGRVAIPQTYRMELQAQDQRAPILAALIDKPALGLYAQNRWQAIEERLESMSQVQPEVQAVRRMLVSTATECPIDGQGRILIPEDLREHAGLDRNVTFAGVGARVEIWSKERYEGEIRATRERAHEIATIAAQLGL
ncbi:MAG TPA: division/cell wall cluster transcriptional repressor MraZ [Myxococcota bacterium]|jgi:MraZ protein|nr:division/cell wall cluster transcriptional repressor MraZ [Myxococcota bacterium]